MQTINKHITRAFTLIELMTATGLTVVMLLLMAGLYSQTADIIRAGIATSDNIERSQAATRELVSIFDYMIPPSAIDASGAIIGFDTDTNTAGRSISDGSIPGGGMLVITNQMWSARNRFGPGGVGPGISDPSQWFPQVNSKRLGLIPDDIRSDMVSFFVFNTIQPASGGTPLNLPTLTPEGLDHFAGDSGNEADATVAKVWIGHLNLVNRDGSPNPGDPGRGILDIYDDNINPVKDSFGNTVANEWVLGMQYMLTGLSHSASTTHNKTLLDIDTSGNTIDGYSDFGTLGTDESIFWAVSDVADYSFLNPSEARASSSMQDRLIIGNGSIQPLMNSLLRPRQQAVNTVGAVSEFLLDNEFSDPIQPDNPHVFYHYKSVALAMSYVNNRLQFNPAPSNELYSYLVAQTHPGFLPYCAEIVVEFAADCDGDGLIDREGFTDLFGATGRNADDTLAGPDGIDDTGVDINWNGINDDGSIIWYSAYQSVNSSGERLGPAMRPNWLKYSLATPNGYEQIPDIKKQSNPGEYPFNNADYAFVWRHDYPNNWPWLLRIRLRLMSRSGVLEFDPNEPQFDYKKRRLKANGDPKVSTSDFSVGVTDEYSRYDATDISYGIDWDPSAEVFESTVNRLPGSWYEFIVPVRRQ